MSDRRNAWRPNGHHAHEVNTRQLADALGEQVAARPGPREWDRLLGLVTAQRQRIDAALAILGTQRENYAPSPGTVERARRVLRGDADA